MLPIILFNTPYFLFSSSDFGLHTPRQPQQLQNTQLPAWAEDVREARATAAEGDRLL
jgi:hypothetical protein